MHRVCTWSVGARRTFYTNDTTIVWFPHFQQSGSSEERPRITWTALTGSLCSLQEKSGRHAFFFSPEVRDVFLVMPCLKFQHLMQNWVLICAFRGINGSIPTDNILISVNVRQTNLWENMSESVITLSLNLIDLNRVASRWRKIHVWAAFQHISMEHLCLVCVWLGIKLKRKAVFGLKPTLIWTGLVSAPYLWRVRLLGGRDVWIVSHSRNASEQTSVMEHEEAEEHPGVSWKEDQRLGCCWAEFIYLDFFFRPNLKSESIWQFVSAG